VLDPGGIALLVKQGEQFVATGDLAVARTVFRRAAEAGDASAAVAMGATYDPEFLKKLGVIGMESNLEKARSWYKTRRKARIRRSNATTPNSCKSLVLLSQKVADTWLENLVFEEIHPPGWGLRWIFERPMTVNRVRASRVMGTAPQRCGELHGCTVLIHRPR
jgi:hypothetical protein